MKKTLESELQENFCKIKILSKEGRKNPKNDKLETFIIAQYYNPIDKRVATKEFKIMKPVEEIKFPINEVILIDGNLKMINFETVLFVNDYSRHFKVIESNK